MSTLSNTLCYAVVSPVVNWIHCPDSIFGLSMVKPPFLRDTENGRNSRNRGVENGKWQVSFSEMIRLIFVQNLSQFGRAFNKMLSKVYLYLLFLQNVALFAFWGHTFAVWMPFSALQWEEMFTERPFCLFTPGEVFLEHCKKFPRFSNFTLLIQKNGKFWSVCTVFDRKRKNTENGKSTKRNLNFIKWRNGGLSYGLLQLVIFAIFSLSMLQAMEIFMITKQDATKVMETSNLKNCTVSTLDYLDWGTFTW